MTLLQRVARSLGERRFLRALGAIYPPYIGAGVRVADVSERLDSLVVEMPLRRWNRNFVGTHFGGSLYAMCDPFFMLLAMMQLGDGYIVWDKSATIEFLKPGKGLVRAEFQLPPERVEALRAEVAEKGKINPVFEVLVTDAATGEAVARITKTLSIRLKAPR